MSCTIGPPGLEKPALNGFQIHTVSLEASMRYEEECTDFTDFFCIFLFMDYLASKEWVRCSFKSHSRALRNTTIRNMKIS